MKPVAPPNAEFPGRAVTIVCGVLACCLMAKAQNADSELAQARDEFIAKLFTKCNDDTYYFGPHEVIHLACGATGRDVTDCAELIEYK